MKVSLSRVAAFEILFRIESEGEMSGSLLPEYESSLDMIDRGLCHELVLGSLRKQMMLDREINHLTKDKKVDLEVRIALRLGLYQIRYLDRIPDHSAINESVELVKLKRKKSAAGFVNAILRRSTRERFVPSYKNELDRISIETSHPTKLIEHWTRAFGADRAELIAKANNERRPISFRSTANTNSDDLQLIEKFRHSEFEGSYVSDSFSRELSDLSENGKIYFQEIGSQLVARSVPIQDGHSFLDLCAAPGSKTTAVAVRTRNVSDFRIVANDNSPKRLEFLVKNAAQQGLDNIHTFHFDAEKEVPDELGSFDTILIDAPCSGTGTVGHNPEIRYRINAAEIARHADRQLNILRNASDVVNVGGVIIYSTCSLELEENEDVCGAFLGQNLEFEICDLDFPTRFRCENGFYRTWPDTDKMDGFFVAGLRKAV